MKVSKEKIKVLVVGLGFRTGLASANFLVDKGYEVAVTDIRSESDLKDIIEKLNDKVKVYAANQEPSILDDGYKLIVLSPGVPRTIPLIQEAYNRNIQVISEVELSYIFYTGKIIAITGTDGKSTTTSLTNYILKKMGNDSYEGGNIGIPLVSLVDDTDENSIMVTELSSFQLEAIEQYKPHVSTVLNISPDHLDRYDSMEEYTMAKFNIFKNQTSEDFFVLNIDEKVIYSVVDRINAKILTFSLVDDNANGFYKDGFVYLNVDGELTKVLDATKLQILGVHNIQNVLASLLMIYAIYKERNENFDLLKFAEACYSYSGLEHRMEMVAEIEKRTFINDSKATTIGAVQMALKSITGSSIFIIGGKEKGDDYSRLACEMRDRVKSLILIGESSERFQEVFKKIDNLKAENMEDAVKKAYEASDEGDVIILSPACASFDMYKSFEERGTVFKEAVAKLKRGDL